MRHSLSSGGASIVHQSRANYAGVATCLPHHTVSATFSVAADLFPLCSFGHGFWRSVWAILSAVVLDFLLVGFAIATAGW